MSCDYEFAEFRINSLNRELLRNGERVLLSPRSFDVLWVLVQHSGSLVGKTSLMDAVWRDTAVEENSLARAISDIRRALGEGAKESRFIETMSRRGYRFLGEVTAVPANSGHGRVETKRSAPADARANRLTTLAILPFAWLKATGNDSSLSVGLADALITRLSNLPQFIVRPTSAILRYEGTGEDQVAVAQALGVDFVISGSIQQAGDHIRVTVQAVSPDERRAIWGDRFDERSTNLFAIEDSISERVAAALTRRLTQVRQQVPGRSPSRSSEAYELNLRGRSLLTKRTFPAAQEAIEAFHRAIEIDPQYAAPWAGVADAHILIGLHGALTGWLPPQMTYPEAKRAALRSIELQPDLADAHCSLAFVNFFYEWDWTPAQQEFDAVFRQQPYHVDARHYYSMMCCFAGHHEEALTAIGLALKPNPSSPVLNANRGYILYFARRYPEAMEQLQHALELDPSFSVTHHRLGLVCSALGMHQEAIDHLVLAEQYSGENPQALGALGFVYGQSGDGGKAREILARLVALSEGRYVSAAIMADVCVGLRQADQTLAWVEKALVERSAAIPRLRVDARYDWLRRDPRFERVVESVRVPGAI